MKTIIYNENNLDEKDINNIVKRAKLLIINSADEIAVVFSHCNYFLIGGHVEDKETDFECLKREIKEEMGVELPLNEAKQICQIKYLNKDYPVNGKNTLSLINYYFLKSDVLPDINNLNLTPEEIEGNFKIEYINLLEAENKLNESLSLSTRPAVVKDTIETIKEYINIYYNH